MQQAATETLGHPEQVVDQSSRKNLIMCRYSDVTDVSSDVISVPTDVTHVPVMSSGSFDVTNVSCVVTDVPNDIINVPCDVTAVPRSGTCVPNDVIAVPVKSLLFPAMSPVPCDVTDVLVM
ncbi:hypothetical protein BTVI_35084 [Pitangus sulphuratus]|nr:hypothetical protein BTVI_35084 [Pitangus sulphuratus]